MSVTRVTAGKGLTHILISLLGLLGGSCCFRLLERLGAVGRGACRLPARLGFIVIRILIRVLSVRGRVGSASKAVGASGALRGVGVLARLGLLAAIIILPAENVTSVF